MGMDDFKRYVRKIALRTALIPLRLCGIRRNRILLINDLGYNYSCNPRAIAEYLITHYKGRYEIVYSFGDMSRSAEIAGKPLIPVKFNSLKYFYYAMTSRVIVTNSGGISYIPLSRRQYVINTHHGGGAYKKVGLDMFEDSYFFRKDLLLSARQTNCFLSTCKSFTKATSKSVLMPEKLFWEIGMPRNDRLLKWNKERAEGIKRSLGLQEGQKLVLYAPTYRKPEDNYYRGSIAIQYGIDSRMVVDALKQRFGGDWIFAYRLHPCVENKKDYIVDGAMDLSEYGDMQDLLEAADVLINDFSSSFWDYMLTGKPGFMYAQDMQHYIDTTEVYTPIEKWPFPKAMTNEELRENILHFDEKEYQAACKEHYEYMGGCESGHATELVCRRIERVCRGSSKRRGK